MQLVPMIGGSGPIHPFVHELGLPVAMAGLGHPDTRAHAPNENIRIDLYLKHARHVARILDEFSRMSVDRHGCARAVDRSGPDAWLRARRLLPDNARVKTIGPLPERSSARRDFA